MCAGPEEHVDVHVARSHEEAVCVPGGDDAVAMGEPDTEGAVGDDAGQGEVGGFGVEVALDDLEV